MIQEHRYVVLKVSDIQKYLSYDDEDALEDLCGIIASGRERDGKAPLNCVCVKDDWPEYEAVWDMIEKRVDGFD